MAAKTVVKRSGSKIRFVMLEADLADGDLTEITHAISNALRQPHSGQRLIATPVRPEVEGGGNGAGAAEAEHEPEVVEEVEEVQETPRATKPRKPTIPNILEVDLKSGDVPFEDFATKKAPNSDLKRHLVVAYWFKKYRDIQPVTGDHAFTCYKKASWPTTIADFLQPFRDLARARKGSFKEKGFTINQFGEDQVEKMGSE